MNFLFFFLLLLMSKHLFCSLCEDAGLLTRHAFLLSIVRFLLGVSSLLPLNSRAMSTPATPLLRSEWCHPLMLATALVNEMSPILLVVGHSHDSSMHHGAINNGLVDLDTVVADSHLSVSHLPELYLTSSASLLGSLCLSLDVTATYYWASHLDVNFFKSFTISITSAFSFFPFNGRFSFSHWWWLHVDSWSLNCHVNCDEVVVRVVSHHCCEHIFIALLFSHFFFLVSNEGLRITPLRIFFPIALIFSLSLVHSCGYNSRSCLDRWSLWMSRTFFLLMVASMLLLFFKVSLLVLLLLSCDVCEDFGSSSKGLGLAVSSLSENSCHWFCFEFDEFGGAGCLFYLKNYNFNFIILYILISNL